MIAPGNFVRAATMPSSSLIDRLDGVMGNLGSLFDLYWIPLVAIVVLAVANFPRNNGQLPEQTNHGRVTFQVLLANRGWIFVLLALAYMTLLLGAPRASLAARVSYPASILFICYIVTVFLRRPVTRQHEWLTATYLLILMAGHMAITVPDLMKIARIHNAWASDAQFRMGPDTHVVLPVVRVKGRTVFVRKHIIFVGFTSDPAYFVNACYARFMHVTSVIAR